MKVALNLSKGIHITGYLVFTWFGSLTEDEKSKIRAEYSTLLKGDLKTTHYKTLKFAEV